MAELQGCAEVKQRGRAILIVANAVIKGWQSEDGAWHGVHITDWDAFVERMTIDTSSKGLGASLRACLLRSRLMTIDWCEKQRKADDYNARPAGAFGLSSTRGLFPGMKNVSVVWSGGRVRLGPSRNRRGGAFEGFELGSDSGHEEIVLPDDVPDAELGSALLDAIRRCL